MGKRKQTTFCELRFKDVINICDGTRLGRVVDIVIDISCSRVRGLIVPGERCFNIFKSPEEIFIPWRNILRIGEDVILVELLFEKGSCKDRPKSKKDKRSCSTAFAGAKAKSNDEDEIKPKVLKYMSKHLNRDSDDDDDEGSDDKDYDEDDDDDSDGDEDGDNEAS